ncbi:MAG: excinuclease ABC subunit UvrA [Acidiferrobacterales bacterium]|nr:excinuclease ABC subunit UvrA [Acidiferrobacterales bacterium]
MSSGKIIVRGARTHNLKNVSVDLPRDKINVITGLSGSGKSSLAFDTIYAEGQRRYVESLSAYARQFLALKDKPDVDSIEGLSPAISINQQATRYSPRSTVGTVTEVYDYLRLLYARIGEPRCPEHGVTLSAKSIAQIVDQVLSLGEDIRTAVIAPVVRDKKGEHEQTIAKLKRLGYVRLRINGDVYEIERVPKLDRNLKNTVEVIVDRLIPSDSTRVRLTDSIETAVELSEGLVICAKIHQDGSIEDEGTVFSANFGCPYCGYVLDELEPRIFSFNNPMGACSQCKGLGQTFSFDPEKVVVSPESSIASGALAEWSTRHGYYYSMLESLARHYGFNLDIPFSALPEAARNLVLYGSGSDKIAMRYTSTNGRVYRSFRPFEGVIPNFERRLRETTSETIKDELAKYQITKPCNSCGGARLAMGPRNVFVDNMAIHELTNLNITETIDRFQNMSYDRQNVPVAERIVRDITQRLQFLADVGLTYVSLDRATSTLSGGELQRIRLASQVGSGLVGVTYVLDEPSIGLHERDNAKLLNTLSRLRNLGNTLVVVEHDETTIRSADHIVDLGPRAGTQGGEVLVQGSVQEIESCQESLTGQYLSGKRKIDIPFWRVPFDEKRTLGIRGAQGNNLKNIDVEIPLGLFTCVTGVSGSGKSTLVNETIHPAISSRLYRSRLSAAKHSGIFGLENIDKIIRIDQQPIGRTPRSNPATYTGLFSHIRKLFARTLEARSRGYQEGRFSFNVRGGRCENCRGGGLVRVEMNFLPDMFVSCEACNGKRYNRETLEIEYKGMNIAEVLDLSVTEAMEKFSAVPALARKLKTLCDVGLEYIRLGQSATTLSGGEAQRIKLSLELSKRDTGSTLYLLDEPTTGLHFEDIRQLLSVILELRDRGNTIVIIEHNLEVIKSADWIIDLGPEGGDEGGFITACGTPEQVSTVGESHTGLCLARALEPISVHIDH